LGSIITDDTQCTGGNKLKNSMTKAAFTRTKTLLTSKTNLNVKKKLVKCYIWSTALCGVETWTLWKVRRKYPESFEMWCWRRMEKISWTDHARNEAVLNGGKKRRNSLYTLKRRKADWIGDIAQEVPSKTRYSREDKRNDRNDGNKWRVFPIAVRPVLDY
jgi:hypothetical protein